MGIQAERAAKTALVGLCLWETTAVTTGLLPTVSQLCRRCRWVEAGLLALLLAHLHLEAGAGKHPARLTPNRTSCHPAVSRRAHR